MFKQILIAVVLFAVLVGVAYGEECIPSCTGEQFIVRTIHGTEYWCDVEWAWIAMGEARLLRIKTTERQKDYPVVNIVSFEAPLGSVPYTKQR